jgi:glycosyltransferase involved in cell wall biosynthesis
MRVAIVHDFLKEYGGAERVLEGLHNIYPEAPVYTAFYSPKDLGRFAQRFEDWDIRTTWAQRIPWINKLYSPLRLLTPLFWESIDFSNYDVVISSTNVYGAKGIITKPSTLHICYCHTPPRFLYGYPTAMGWEKHFWGKMIGLLLNHVLRQYDFLASQRVDFFIAGSKNAQERIKKFYRRESTVIYPPVELEVTNPKFQIPNKKNEGAFFLCVGRLVAGKRIDLAIEACVQLDLPLKIVGRGRDEEKLHRLVQRIDKKHIVEFLGEVSDNELAGIYQNCRAVIFPAQEEDFGIVPVEAMSFGKPVIALKQGGVAESVVEGKTGAFFDEPTVNALAVGLSSLDSASFKPEDCREQAMNFSEDIFKKKITSFIESKIRNSRIDD